MRGSPTSAFAGAVLWLLASALPAIGQLPEGQPPPPPAPAPAPEPPPRPLVPEPEVPLVEPPAEARPAPVPEEPELTPTPGVAPPSFVGPDLFNPPPHRGWITLTPSITIYGAYTDNLFLTGRNETEEFFGGFSPGLTLSMRRPEYRLLAGYNFSAEYYQDETQLNEPFKNQRAFVDGFYRVGPRLTLGLVDRFIQGRDTISVTGGVSAGRRDSWRNTLIPRLRYQAAPLTALNVTASYSVLRFDENGDARDSDTYRLTGGAEHQFTRRFTGLAEMGIAYLDAEDEPAATTYTPRLGAEYQFTPTLRGLLSGGPVLTTREGEPDRVTPAIRARLEQVFRTGTLVVGYEQTVSADTIGIRDRQIAFASLNLVTLLRGLGLTITPRYSRLDRDIEGGERTIDSFSVNVGATYQLARSIALIASYTFFAQREDDVDDIDQNRAFFGLQYAYPINFD